MKNSVLRQTDRRMDRQSTSAHVELRFAAKNTQHIVDRQKFIRSHNKRDIARRLKRNHLNETVKHLIWNSEYKKRFDTKKEIPSVFIDPVIDFEFAEEEEMILYKNYTTKLFKLSNTVRPYECSIYCKAPQGFFSGQPWLMEPKEAKARLGSTATFNWQIWKKGCTSSGNITDNFKVHFNDRVIKNTSSFTIEETVIGGNDIKQV